MPVTVAIVEDNAGICTELERVIASDPEFTTVVTCRNLQTALRRIPPLSPEIVIMDIKLPDGSGIDGVVRLKRVIPQTHIMMFTIYEDSEQIFRALQAGASGYLLKGTKPESFLAAMHELKAGGGPMSGEVARKVIESFHRKTRSTEELTPREEEILHLLSKGYLSKEIAAELSITVGTVNIHLKHIYEKLHVRSRTEAVIKYLH